MATLKRIRKAFKNLRQKKSILLRGTHGCGKTEWVKSLAEEMGLKLVIWHASHAADAADLTGMPQIIDETIEWTDKVTHERHSKTRKVMTMVAPDWMQQEEPVLLLLDEINRGLGPVMNAIMQLTNDQTYDNISLPEGSRIVACINPEKDGSYNVSTLDPAQFDRFAVYDFTPTPDEWIEWAETHGVADCVISFIKANESYLDPYSNAELCQCASDEDVLPSRRSWVDVSELYKNGLKDGDWEGDEGEADLSELVAGLVGLGASIAFMAHLNDKCAAFTPRTVLEAEEIPEITLKAIEERAEAGDTTTIMNFIGNCELYLNNLASQGVLKLPRDGEKDEYTTKIVGNFYKLLNKLPKDAMVASVTKYVYSAIEKKRSWTLIAFKVEPKLKDIVRKAKEVKSIEHAR